MPLRTSHKHDRVRALWIALAVAVLLLAACAVLFARAKVRPNENRSTVHETSLTVSDLDRSVLSMLSEMQEIRSVSVENPVDDPETIRDFYELMPDCSLAFRAMLSGGPVECDAERVPVSMASDFLWLPYFKALKTLYLDPQDLPADDLFLDAASSYLADHPGTEVICADGSPFGFRPNSVGEQCDFTELDAERISFLLPFLPSGSSVILPDSFPDDHLNQVLDQFTELTFRFPDGPVGSGTAVIAEHMETEALLELLASYRKLSSVDLSAFETEWEQIAAVSERFPEAEILFKTEVYGMDLDSETDCLILDGIRIEDVSPIERLLSAAPNLKQIDMCGCGVPDEEMAAFRSRHPDRKIVWTVDLKHWMLRTDATHFATWNRIKLDEDGYIVTARNVGGNTSKSLAPLQYCTDLVALDLGHNKITDLSFLSGLKNLKYLIIALNEVTDLTPLAGLSELKYLEIFSNENIRDISPLSGLTKLEALCMSDTKVTDISPLYGNQALRRLYLQGYRFDKQAREEIAKALPDCTVLYKTLGSTGSDWRQSEYYPEMRKALGWKVD